MVRNPLEPNSGRGMDLQQYGVGVTPQPIPGVHGRGTRTSPYHWDSASPDVSGMDSAEESTLDEELCSQGTLGDSQGDSPASR